MTYHVDRAARRQARDHQIRELLEQGCSHREVGLRLNPPISATAVTHAISKSPELRKHRRRQSQTRRELLKTLRQELVEIRSDVRKVIEGIDDELAGMDIDEALAT